MTMHIEAPKDSSIILMTRIFDAPRDVVWTAFTEPQHVSKWYGGSAFGGRVRAMDVRPGGIWSHTMRFDNGNELEVDFVYVEVVRPERLVWKNHGPLKPGLMNVIQAVTLEDLGAKTRWSLRSTFDSVADRDRAVGFGFAVTIEAGSNVLNEIAIGLTAELAARARSMV